MCRTEKEGKDLSKELVLTIPEVARLIHCDPGKVRSLVKAGHIRALKLGELKIRRQEIDRFLAEAEGKDYSDPDSIKELRIC